MFPLIVLSIFLGIACGIFFPQQMITIKWIGQVFINMLKLIVLPLIFCALVSAIASLGAIKKLGSIGIYTLAYVLFSVSVAVFIGLVLLNTFQPGNGVAANLILANATPIDLKPVPFSSYLLTLFPPNILEAAVKYEIMPIVFFSIVFAISCLSVGKTAHPVIDLIIGLRDVFVKMVIWLMYLTPIGLFSLLASAIAEASLQHLLLKSLGGMLMFIIIFLFGLFLQTIWQLAFVVFVVGKSSKDFLSNASSALITAFATSSSMATLPVTLLVAKKQIVSDEEIG